MTQDFDRLARLIEAGTPGQELAEAVVCKAHRPGDPWLKAARGHAQYRDWEGAEQRLARAEALDPQNPGLWSTRTYLLSLQGKLEQEKEVGEKAMAQGVVSADVFNNLGYTYELLGDCRRAIPLFERARHLNPFSRVV